jgi:hypothetical protein
MEFSFGLRTTYPDLSYNGQMKYLLLVGLVVAVCLAGCGNRESRLVGTWQGAVELSEEDRSNPMAGMLQSMVGTSNLELKADKTFTAQIMAMAVQGSWRLEGDQVLLESTSGGSADWKLTLAKDGKTLRMDQGDRSGSEFVFTKTEG